MNDKFSEIYRRPSAFKLHYKSTEDAVSIVGWIAGEHIIDEEAYLNDAYDLLLKGEKYDEVLEELTDRAKKEDPEEVSHRAVDPAFASWEDCNRQFI
ncbi:MAG: hypothetical protein UIG52_00635 [Bacteroidales bacterium]|nr:hypothetical protein [Bacteroidales bacterium]